MATTFVALPLVIREVVPVLEEIGDDQEQAASSLGANALQTFWRITLPGIKWAVVYGVVLSLARSLGEFGAVKIVAGNVIGETQTAHRARRSRSTRTSSSRRRTPSRSCSSLVAVLCLVVVALLRPKEASHSEKMSIDVTGVTKKFGDFVALDDVTVSLPTGQLTALLGPVRRRQVDAAADHRGARPGRHRHRRPSRAARPRTCRARKRNVGLRLPALRGLQAHVGGQERRVRPRDPQAAQGRDRASGSTSCSTWCTSRSSRDRMPVAALGRPAPAHGAGPGARGRADGAAARRAVRRARREGPQGAARLAAPAARRGAHHDDLRDPRPGGGPRGRRRDRGHQRRPGRADRQPRHSSTTSRPTTS